MAKVKVCPILQAGRMASGIGTRGSMGYPGSDIQFSATIHYDQTSFCMGEDCEWFEHGCPAHQVTKEWMRTKIQAMKYKDDIEL